PLWTVQRLLGRTMWMHPDRAVDLAVRLRDRQHLRERLEAGADGLHEPDAGRTRPGEHRVALLGEPREIEMAVAIDQHRPSRRQSAGTRRTARAAACRGAAR